MGKFCDISNSGIRIEIGTRLAPGDAVEVIIGDSILFGSVAHCTACGSVFEIGAKIEKVKLGSADLSKSLSKALAQVLPDCVRTRTAP
jgi:hypothetical protein